VDDRFYPWGDGFDPSFANMKDSLPGRMQPAAVGAFPVDESPFGVRDMAGGMVDWCADGSEGDLPTLEPGERAPPVATSGGHATYRVRRGGCWYFSESSLRSTFRYIVIPSSRSPDLGFRLARSYP